MMGTRGDKNLLNEYEDNLKTHEILLSKI